jgi:hypothetical protein
VVEDVPRSLDDHVGAMWSCVAEAFCSVLNHGTDLGPLDADVLFEYLNCTGMHVSNVVRAIRPALRSPDPAERETALTELTGRTFPPFDPFLMTRSLHVANLARDAIEHGRAADAEAIRLRSHPQIDVVLDELSDALGHLEVVLFLTDPDAFIPGPDADDRERILLAEVRDICERDVEETRARLARGLEASWN